MKNLFLGSLALAATIAGPAMAADLPYKAPPPLPVAYPLSDAGSGIFGVEYQHFDLNGARAFCVRPGCNPPAVRDFDLSATGDLVRARLTIKTQGFSLVR